MHWHYTWPRKSLPAAIVRTLKCITFITVRRCPPRGKPTNGRVVGCNEEYKGFCEMACNTGYKLHGVARSRCVMSKSKVYWSNPRPSCQGKKIRSLRRYKSFRLQLSKASVSKFSLKKMNSILSLTAL